MYWRRRKIINRKGNTVDVYYRTEKPSSKAGPFTIYIHRASGRLKRMHMDRCDGYALGRVKTGRNATHS